MKFLKTILLYAVLLFYSSSILAQEYYIEGGLGLGGIAGKKHDLGKAEIHASLFKVFNFGFLGLDLATGGNFIPGTRSTEEPGIETLSPNDTRFSTVTLLYRRYMGNYFYVEPRLGYASLSAFVHTDDKVRLTQSNLSAGIGCGGTLDKVSLSLRYQYFGKTRDYMGFKDNTLVKSIASPVSMILLRMSVRFPLK